MFPDDELKSFGLKEAAPFVLPSAAASVIDIVFVFTTIGEAPTREIKLEIEENGTL
jgi:hypothetical protein